MRRVLLWALGLFLTVGGLVWLADQLLFAPAWYGRFIAGAGFMIAIGLVVLRDEFEGMRRNRDG